MADRGLHNETEENRLSFGDYGLRVLTTTSVAGEYFACLYATEASQIDATNTTDGGDTTITNLVLPAGGVIYGNFTSITVDSGKIIGYLRDY
jgi:hypothetical protein